MTEKLQDMPVTVEDFEALKGQYLRHAREQTVWKIVDVGRQGVTTFQAEHYGGDTFGPETCITWAAVLNLYKVMVHVADIEAKGQT